VTTFVFRAHPVSNVWGGPIFWDIEDAKRVMQWYRDFLPKAPEELGSFLALKAVPSKAPFPEEIWGKKIGALICCYNGTQEEAEAATKSIETLPEPIFSHVGMMPFPALQSLFDQFLPEGLQWYWKGDFLNELPDEAIDLHIEYTKAAVGELSLTHFYPIDGAVHRVGRSDTAWSCRNATWSMVIAAIDPDAGKADALKDWGKKYWQAVHPFSLRSCYVNFMMDEDEDRVRSTYGENCCQIGSEIGRCLPSQTVVMAETREDAL
jgi:hypothetical protein